jgi:hypothetical protein
MISCNELPPFGICIGTDEGEGGEGTAGEEGQWKSEQGARAGNEEEYE